MAIYYFSNSGSDTNNGASESTPWQTQTKFDAIKGSLVAGDSILFKRGEVFNWQITPTVSGASGNPIVFGAYGIGVKPIINGLVSITGWTNTGGNIWTKTYTGSNNITGLFLNDIAQIVGRYPKASDANKGYLLADSGSSTTLVDASLSGGTNWTGAEVVIKTKAWVFEIKTVNSFSGSTLNFSGTTYPTVINSGYFFQHDSRACTVQGEWSYNKATKQISVYSTVNPETLNVQVTGVENLFDTNAKSYYTFQDIHLKGSSGHIGYGFSASGITFNNCEISDAMRVFQFWGGNNQTINGCYIHDVNSNVYLTKYINENTIFTNNYIENVGLVAGMGFSGVGTASVINSAGTGFTCEDNTILNVGYLGIGWRGDAAIVRRNYIKNFCSILDDGSAIYTYNGDSSFPSTVTCYVEDNIIDNAVGAPEGSPATGGASGNGIYCDDGSNNIQIWNNTIKNVITHAVYLHNSNYVSVKYNTIYRAKDYIRMYDDSLHSNNCENNTIEDNTYISVDSVDRIVSLQSASAEMFANNVMDNNRIIQPYGNPYQVSYYVNAGSNGANTPLGTWKTLFPPYEANSVMSSPIALTVEDPDEYIKIEYNATNANVQRELSASYVDKDGVAVLSPVLIPAFSSIALFKVGELTPPDISLIRANKFMGVLL